MSKNEIDIIRLKVMERLKDEFDEAGIAAIMREPNEFILFHELAIFLPSMGMETDRDVIAEYSFLPIQEEDTLQTFLCMYTLTDELPKDHIGEVFAAIAQLNYYLPYGTFGVSPADGKMVYKISTPLPLDLDEEALYKQLEILISTGFNVTDQFVDILMEIAEGTSSVFELSDYIGLDDEEEMQ